MELSPGSKVLFALIDHEVDRFSESIRNQVFLAYSDVPFTPEQREALEPLIREQLDEFVQSVLGIFNNVGAVIEDNPERIIGYNIRSVHSDDRTGGTFEGPDIVSHDLTTGYMYMDYSDMWWNYLQDKREGLL